MCNKHARCGHCIHEVCECFIDWHEEADAVGYWPTRKPQRKTLVKRTSYPASFSLSNSQYRAVMAGLFGGAIIVDSRTGNRLATMNSLALMELVERAETKVADDGEIYFVCRW